MRSSNSGATFLPVTSATIGPVVSESFSNAAVAAAAAGSAITSSRDNR
jgi:hypothetical protein